MHKSNHVNISITFDYSHTNMHYHGEEKKEAHTWKEGGELVVSPGGMAEADREDG